MSLTIAVTAGKTLARNEKANNAKLNALGLPTLALSGTASTAQIGDDQVTAAKAAFGAWFYCTASGTNTITLTATGHSITLTEGMIARFKVAADNTGAVDITFGGSTKDLFRYYNSTTSAGVELAAGDLRAGQQVEIIYDGTRWQLLSALGSMPVIVGTDAGSTDAYAITPSPSVRAYADITGIPVVFKANTINTPAATLEVSGLGSAKPIVKSYNVAVSDGDIKAGQWVTVVYDGTNFQLQSPVTTGTPAVIRDVARGLVARNHSTNPTYQITLTADEVALKDGSGNSLLASSVSVTVDISTTGTNGRATGGTEPGSEQNSTWYYLWIISNGTTTAGLLSVNNPVENGALPSGYTYRALVGAVYNDSGGDLDTFYQSGRDVWLDASASSSVAFTNQTGSNNAWSSQSLGAIVPPIAKAVAGTVGRSAAASTSSDNQMAVAGDSSGQTICSATWGSPSSDVGNAVDTFLNGHPFDLVPLRTSQTVWWKTYTNTASIFRMVIRRYTI